MIWGKMFELPPDKFVKMLAETGNKRVILHQETSATSCSVLPLKTSHTPYSGVKKKKE